MKQIVAVRLFSIRSQMTSKCGKSKKMADELLVECVTDVLTTFTHGIMESICQKEDKETFGVN